MSSPRSVASRAALLVTVLATAAVDARLQNQSQPTFRTDASYVRLDVYPTANGAPVTDLTRDDFEVFEDNRPQAVTSFEHVTIRGGVPQDLRAEPNTVAESKALLQNPRSRAFVVFLDRLHVEVDGSHNIRQPLINALDRLIGPDDLVGVMTPEMSAADVTFARRTTTIEGFLSRHWDWGERNKITVADPREQQYQLCYPGYPTNCLDDRGIADAMILRRREKAALDAVDELVRYLGTVREERTAVITISDGWLLYRPDASLSRLLDKCGATVAPAGQPMGVDPRTGRPVVGRTGQTVDGNLAQCEADRLSLAQTDDRTQFQTMLDRANRSNVSFYPVDPRGLVVFDTPIDTPRTGLPPDGAPSFTPPAQDSAMLRARQSSLRDLAAATDGIASINSNDLDRGFRRITDDLSSYYLLGYYSNGKLDGKFHAIRVRVKRPGVQVRARRGYLALTAAEAAVPGGPTSRRNSGGPAATVAASAVTTALAALGGATRDAGIHLSYAVSGTTAQPATDSADTFWAVGEFGAGEEWRQGAEVDLTLTAADGRIVSSRHERVTAGTRGFRSPLKPERALTPGDYTLRARVSPSGPSSEPVTEMLRVAVPASRSSGFLVSRRGPTTGNREMPAADLRFRRAEQLRVDVPTATSTSPTARLLDRMGSAMAVPVTPGTRTDPDGARWISAALSLAPLAPGDYVIEITDDAGIDSTRTLVAFRVVQ
jgi:VWFA-related protein